MVKTIFLCTHLTHSQKKVLRFIGNDLSKEVIIKEFGYNCMTEQKYQVDLK